MDQIKLSFKNTLWFLVPSAVLFLALGVPDLYRSLDNVNGLKANLSIAYYMLLLPNIPFFIASYALFIFLAKGLNRILSVFLSNGLAIVVWFSTLYLSRFLIRLYDIGYTALVLFAIAILALIVFFIRSIYISVYYTPVEVGSMTSEIVKPTSSMHRILNYGLIILIVLFILLLFTYFWQISRNLPPKKNLKLSAVRLRHVSDFSLGAFLATAGGENRSNYLKDTTQKGAGQGVLFLLYLIQA